MTPGTHYGVGMRPVPIQSESAPSARGGYTQALLVGEVSEWLFVSGQIPESKEGLVPSSFGEQCRLVWSNVLTQLSSAGMGAEHLVKVTTFLSDRRFADENGEIRREMLGPHGPALTVIISEIFDERWLLEIEAIAAR